MEPFNERRMRRAQQELVAARSRVESLEFEDSEIQAFLRRIVAYLELLNSLPPYDGDGGGPLFERAFRSLLPTVHLDWESKEPRDQSELSDVDRASFQMYLQQRSILAQESMALPSGWARRKMALIDLLTEGLQVFIVYPDETAMMPCLALLCDLTGLGVEESEEVGEESEWVC